MFVCKPVHVFLWINFASNNYNHFAETVLSYIYFVYNTLLTYTIAMFLTWLLTHSTLSTQYWNILCPFPHPKHKSIFRLGITLARLVQTGNVNEACTAACFANHQIAWLSSLSKPASLAQQKANPFHSDTPLNSQTELQYWYSHTTQW